jgi:hypothetical protein
MAVNNYFNNFPTQQRVWNEFSLMEDVIVESIKIMGHNVYYIPRESFDEGDMIFGEYAKSAFNKAYVIEAYLVNVNSHGGQQDFFTKFGLEIRDDDNFIISRRSFLSTIPGSLRERPQEGDLVYVPVLRKMFEIKFVEHELMFHSIGKRLPFVYDMKCEAFRASQEQIATGVQEIDQVGIDNLYTIDLSLVPATGYPDLDYLHGETVFQSPNNQIVSATSTGTVKQWFKGNNTLQVYNVVGNFTQDNLIIGKTSNTHYRTAVVDTMTDYNYYDMFDNKQLNTDAAEVLDLSEFNPFGTP